MLEEYRITQNFTYGEFSCPHCGENRISVALVEMLQVARNWSNELGTGVSYRINSGYRCPIHNRAVGGTDTSAHLEGIAADIAIRGSYYRMCIIHGLIRAGFTRIGDYASWFHVDMRDTPPTMWRE